MLKRGSRHLRISDPLSDHSGMTLIEIMVSTGLMGVVMVALMFLLYQSGLLGQRMDGSFQSIEGAAEAVSMFNSVFPGVTRIQTCLCQSNTSTRQACIWSSANYWYDPVITGGAVGGSTPIVTGEFEAYDGLGASATSMASLITNAISIPGETCAASQSSMTASQMRGCKLSFQLRYTAQIGRAHV